MPHRSFAEMQQKPEGKGKGQRTDGELKQTEMFIGDLSGNDSVDLFFEKRIVWWLPGASAISSRMFAFVFVDNFI